MRYLTAFALAIALGGAPPPRATRQHVLVPVWPASDVRLEPGQLEATLNGRPARVTDVRDPASDLMLVLVIDLTGDLSLADSARQYTAEVTGRPDKVTGRPRPSHGTQPSNDSHPV